MRRIFRGNPLFSHCKRHLSFLPSLRAVACQPRGNHPPLHILTLPPQRTIVARAAGTGAATFASGAATAAGTGAHRGIQLSFSHHCTETQKTSGKRLASVCPTIIKFVPQSCMPRARIMADIIRAPPPTRTNKKAAEASAPQPFFRPAARNGVAPAYHGSLYFSVGSFRRSTYASCPAVF